MCGHYDLGDVEALVEEMVHYQNLIAIAQDKLDSIQGGCLHQWTKPVHEKTLIPYPVNGRVSSDPSFSHPGISIRGASHRVDTWHRYCVLCKKKERTTTREIYLCCSLKEPIFDDNTTPPTQRMES